MLDPLRDGYDYMDNVMGSCVLPCLGITQSLLFTAEAICDLISSFRTTNANEKARYQDKAALSYMWASCIFASSLLIFASSLVGLITRPAMTLAQGWNKSNEPRFKDEFSKENSMQRQVIMALAAN